MQNKTQHIKGSVGDWAQAWEQFAHLLIEIANNEGGSTVYSSIWNRNYPTNRDGDGKSIIGSKNG